MSNEHLFAGLGKYNLSTKVMLLDAGYSHAIGDLRRQWEKVDDERNWVFFSRELPAE